VWDGSSTSSWFWELGYLTPATHILCIPFVAEMVYKGRTRTSY
jgi:hypothetical protein